MASGGGPVTPREAPPGPGIAEALAVLAAWLGLESALASLVPAPPTPAAALLRTAGVRAGETAVLLAWARLRGWGPRRLGITGPAAGRGVLTGLGVAAGFAAAVAVAETAGRFAGLGSILESLAGPRTSGAELAALLAAGAVVAPAYEELLFRGVLYGALRRRWGITPAVFLTTALFAAAHLGRTPVPWTQALGGVVFCLVYERSGSLWAPYAVHALGNAALFLLPWVVG